MRFQTALAAIAAFALLGENVEARRKASKWSVKHTSEVRTRMERTFGKGLTGLSNPLTGEMDPTKFGLDNRVTGGARLGTSIYTEVMPGLVIDATGAMAFWLGWARAMQYDGLETEDSNSPVSNVVLSDCFASMYALMTDVENFGYNLRRERGRGEFKGFTTWIKDPIHIGNNFVVNYEMCQLDAVLSQAKQMASLDMAAIADNVTRELMVIAVEMPEAWGLVKQIKDATKCAQQVVNEFAKQAEEEGIVTEWSEWGADTPEEDRPDESAWDTDSGSWENFQADPFAAGQAAYECFDLVDRFQTGQVVGKLTQSFFNNAVKPVQ